MDYFFSTRFGAEVGGKNGEIAAQGQVAATGFSRFAQSTFSKCEIQTKSWTRGASSSVSTLNTVLLLLHGILFAAHLNENEIERIALEDLLAERIFPTHRVDSLVELRQESRPILGRHGGGAARQLAALAELVHQGARGEGRTDVVFRKRDSRGTQDAG